MSAIKGTAMESVVEDVNRLLAERRLRRDELEVRLEPADFGILDGKVHGASWYPVDTYGRLSELLLEVEGRGDPEYLVERGRRAAERLQGTGIYSQLSATRERWGDKVGAIMTSLGPAMFKDSVWHYELGSEDGREFTVRVEVSPGFPEPGRYAAQGFIHYLARQNDPLARVTSRRSTDTELEFRGGGAP